MGGKIAEVEPGSIAEELGIESGDTLLAINDEPVCDLIDYNYYQESSYLELTIEKPNGETWICEVEKFPEEELGLVFTANVFDGIRSCHNHCLFCFIDQLQPNPRASLLLKDDDYRMSFMEGSFITCTNLSEDDYQRIAEMRLSPLYISVHAVDPLLRQRLLGRTKPAEILLTLQRLIAMGCGLHTQIVLCPGINDGEALSNTLDALSALAANKDKSLAGGILSIAVVPVGLTKHQTNPQLRFFSQAEAAAIIDDIENRQRKCLEKTGSRLIWPSDEMYLQAKRDFPAAESYEGYPQIENGVGLVALFMERWQEISNSIPKSAAPPGTAIVSGKSGAIVLRPVLEQINKVSGSDIELITAENIFYGEEVTVSGLLTGTCLSAAIAKDTYQRIIIPSSMLKFDEDIFLDDMPVSKLAELLGSEIIIVEPHPAALLAALFKTEDE